MMMMEAKAELEPQVAAGEPSELASEANVALRGREPQC